MTEAMGRARNARVMQNVAVPMRDGVPLMTTVLLPLAPATSGYPAVLVRTAYGRAGFGPGEFTERGLALVVQDCRGRYGSGGDYVPFVNETRDGEDTLAWLAAQPWCNGRIGMFGDSYLAATQFAVGASGVPALCALNPRFMAGDIWQHAYYCDGAFSLGLTWSWLCFEVSARTSNAASMSLFDVGRLLRELPLRELDVKSGFGEVPAYRDYVAHDRRDAFWRALSVREKLPLFTAPTLLTAGWYDYYAGETFANYAALLRTNDAALAGSHRVLVGPWTHGVNPTSRLGHVDFGPQALAENDATVRWLDGLLKGGRAETFQKAPIRLFVMGANAWRDEHEWPLARTRFTRFYLHSQGRANSLLGDGALATEPPGSGVPDQFTYDPESPVPTLGGNHSIGPYNPGLYELAPPGPFDQRPIERRDDVLVYTTPPLPEDTEVTGPIELHLFAASSAPDTDFVGRLTDVFPDGRSINLTEGVIRARFRERCWDQPRLMQPGIVYEFVINLQATSNVFEAGHRICLDVTSSSFPLWDRNLNTGEPGATATRWQVARQTIYHDRERQSHLLLPVIPPMREGRHDQAEAWPQPATPKA